MKVLSLRQPWAWLVVHGGKDIENRQWNSHFRGEFLIHAAKRMTRTEYDEAVHFAMKVDEEFVLRMPMFDEYERGGIVGQARLVEVIRPCLSKAYGERHAGCGLPWHMHDQFGFVLRDVKPLPFRPMAGSLGFFGSPSRTRGR